MNDVNEKVVMGPLDFAAVVACVILIFVFAAMWRRIMDAKKPPKP